MKVNNPLSREEERRWLDFFSLHGLSTAVQGFFRWGEGEISYYHNLDTAPYSFYAWNRPQTTVCPVKNEFGDPIFYYK